MSATPGRFGSLRPVSPPKWVAPVLLTCSVLVFFFDVVPAKSALATAVKRESERKAVVTQAKRTAAPAVGSLRQSDPYQVQAFRRHLATEELESDWLVLIHALADRLGLSLDEVQYARTKSSLRGFAELKVTTAVRGPFPMVQAYIDILLARVPVLALDRIIVSTPRSSAGHVHASLEMTLFAEDRQ